MIVAALQLNSHEEYYQNGTLQSYSLAYFQDHSTTSKDVYVSDKN